MARNQDPSTLCGIGDLYINKGHHEAYARALEWYRLASKKSFSEAEYRLGRCFMNGWGIHPNMDEALSMFKLSSAHFHPVSMYKVGFLYHYGLSREGVDYEKARAWYLKAAQYNVAKAQYNIGVIYEMALGVKKDVSVAVAWYGKSEELGFFLAKECLRRIKQKRRAFAFLKPRKGFDHQISAIEELSGITTNIDADMPNVAKSALLASTPELHKQMLLDDNEKGESWTLLDDDTGFNCDRGFQSDRGISASDIDMRLMVDDLKNRSRNFFQRLL
jgi:TPR repeat protein